MVSWLSWFPRGAVAADAGAIGTRELRKSPRGERSVEEMPVEGTLAEDARARELPPELLRSRRDFLPLVVGLAWGAGIIHATAIPAHLGESFLHGVFFVVAASLQLIWGALAYRDSRPRVLMTGALGSCSFAALWLASRTVGTPASLKTWEAEPVGVLDVLATVDELALAGVVGLMLGARYLLTTRRLLMTSILVGILLTASVVAPMLASHQHG